MLSEQRKEHLSWWVDKQLAIFGHELFIKVFNGPKEIVDGLIEAGVSIKLTGDKLAYRNELIENRDEAEKLIAGKLGMM